LNKIKISKKKFKLNFEPFFQNSKTFPKIIPNYVFSAEISKIGDLLRRGYYAGKKVKIPEKINNFFRKKINYGRNFFVTKS
jgi:hypothetical protein